MPWTVRPLANADAADVARLFRISREAAMPWLPDLHTPEEDLAFFSGELASSAGWAAEADGVLVGFALARDGWLNHLYIAPEWQGQGIGSALLDEARRASDDALELWAFERNTPATAFYGRHGFAIAERTDGAGNQEREPDVRMGRGVRTRAGTPADAEPIARVHVAAWQQAYRGLMPDDLLDGLDWRERAVDWAGRLADPTSRVLVVTVDGSIRGFAAHGPARDEELIREQQGWWEVYALYVGPGDWGHGLGTRLWTAVRAAAPEEAAAICLWVLAGNARARAAYETWGLAPDGGKRQRDMGAQGAAEVRYVIWL